MNPASRLSRPPGPDVSATAFLGDDHPLVRVSDSLGVLLKQALVVAAVASVSLGALIEGVWPAGALVLAAAIVEGALACAAAWLAHRKRACALALIREGRGDLPIAAVRRERARLLDPGHREDIAQWLDATREEAERRTPRPPYARPLFNVRVVRAAQPQLRELAQALRREDVGLRGVVRTQQLLERGTSPLYGHDLEALRHELQQILFLLDY